MAEGGVPAPEGGDEVDERELDAQEHAARRIALAQIRQYPDKVLKMRAREVETFDDDLARLAEKMGRLMHDARWGSGSPPPRWASSSGSSSASCRATTR